MRREGAHMGADVVRRGLVNVNPLPRIAGVPLLVPDLRLDDYGVII